LDLPFAIIVVYSFVDELRELCAVNIVVVGHSESGQTVVNKDWFAIAGYTGPIT